MAQSAHGLACTIGTIHAEQGPTDGEGAAGVLNEGGVGHFRNQHLFLNHALRFGLCNHRWFGHNRGCGSVILQRKEDLLIAILSHAFATIYEFKNPLPYREGILKQWER